MLPSAKRKTDSMPMARATRMSCRPCGLDVAEACPRFKAMRSFKPQINRFLG